MEDLFFIFQQTRSLSIRNCLVEENLGLARKVAHTSVAAAGIEYEDAYGLAVVGLIKAVERFNPEENKFFSSFAIPYIRGEIQHYMRDKSSTVRLHRRYQDYASKLNKIVRKYQKQGIEPSRGLLIKELEVSEEIFAELEIAIMNRNHQMCLDMKIPGSDDLTLGEAIPSEVFPSIDAIISELQEIVGKIEKMNPPLIRRVLCHYFFQAKNIQQIASALNISDNKSRKLLNHGIEILGKDTNLNFSEICSLIANFSEADIKLIWEKASTCLDSFSAEQFYNSLAA